MVHHAAVVTEQKFNGVSVVCAPSPPRPTRAPRTLKTWDIAVLTFFFPFFFFLRGNEPLSAQCLKNGRAQRSRNIVPRSDVGVLS